MTEFERELRRAGRSRRSRRAAAGAFPTAAEPRG